VAAADVNRDGRPDLLVVNAGTNNVSVLLNTTGSTLTLPPPQTATPAVTPLRTATATTTPTRTLPAAPILVPPVVPPFPPPALAPAPLLPPPALLPPPPAPPLLPPPPPAPPSAQAAIPEVPVIPEGESLALLAVGLAALGAFAAWRLRRPPR
jgi:hypothetical protein